MTDETTIVNKPPGVESSVSHKHTEESQFGGITVRGWLATVFVFTICFTHICVAIATLYNAIINKDFSMVGSLTTIGEPLYSLSIAAVSYYFGAQKMKGMLISNGNNVK